MADTAKAARRFLNPWVLHLQKLELELKCPLCLSLFDQPVLLPCNHISCKSCLDLNLSKLECPICHASCSSVEIRPSPHMENMVAVYKNMDTTLSATLQQPAFSGAEICSMTAVNRRSTSDFMHEQLCGSTTCKSKDGNCKNKTSIFDSSAAKGHQSCKLDRGSTVPQEQGNPVMEGLLQSAPDTPPSFGGPRGDDDSTDQGSEHTKKRCHSTDILKEKCDKESVDRDRCSEEHEFRRDVKRLKLSPCELAVTDTVAKGTSRQEVNSCYSKPHGGASGSKQVLHTNSSSQNKIKCAFCQSSKVFETTGLMLHYSNGVPVEGDGVFHANVIHVHEKCIMWAPQVYYEGDNVKKLKAEVSRGAKLKCSKCGIKGAALGCFATSCKKSFHVTCAMEISGCRWDCYDYLMLCPSHASLKFPSEKSITIKKNSEEGCISQEMSNPSNLWATSSDNGEKEWVLCGSALTSEERSILVKFGTKNGISVKKKWDPAVTHIIASTDDTGACCRTFKVLMGILHGAWILKIDWIRACAKAQRPVAEEPYEICIDNHGCLDGPKTGRLRALNNEPKIFWGLSFYFSGDYIPDFKHDLQNLVAAAGGVIISSIEELRSEADNQSEMVVVYNFDPLYEGPASGEDSLVHQRREEAVELARLVGDRAVAHTWLLESISACKLLPWVA